MAWRRAVRRISTWASHIEELRLIVGPGNIRVGDEATQFTTDWTRHYAPSTRDDQQAVVLPSSTREVQQIMEYINKFPSELSGIPQGGNTGLVGGGVGVRGSKRGEVIIALQRMNRIISVDPSDSTLVCESGCVLEALNHSLESKYNLTMPIAIGSKGQCQIGGNVATNAGGLNVIKYGPLAAYVLGLEVVTGSGEVLDMLRTNRKDNMGLRIPSLFIGSEGLLGIITKVAMSVVPVPRFRQVLVCTLRGFADDVPAALRFAREELGESLSAFEFMDYMSLRAVQKAMPSVLSGGLDALVQPPLSAHSEGIDGNIVLLVEVSSGSPLGDRLISFLDQLTTQGLLAQGGAEAILSQSAQQEAALWRIRENVPVALAQLARDSGGVLLKHDVSLSLKDMSPAVCDVKKQLMKESYKNPLVACFGHAGDSNLHLNVLLEGCGGGAEVAVKSALDRAVAKAVSSRRGSLSAEHGVGQQKIKLMPLVRTPEELRIMAGIKRVFDPQNVLQPGKVIP